MNCPACDRERDEHTIKELQTCHHDWLVGSMREWAEIAAAPPMHEDYYRLNMALLGIEKETDESAWINDNIHLDPDSVIRMANERMVAMFFRLYENELNIAELALGLKSAWLEGMATGMTVRMES